MQTKWMSVVETAVNVVTGFAMSMVISHLLLPVYFNQPVSWNHNFQITLIFTLFSLVRGYFVRRIFNKLYLKSLSPALSHK